MIGKASLGLVLLEACCDLMKCPSMSREAKKTRVVRAPRELKANHIHNFESHSGLMIEMHDPQMQLLPYAMQAVIRQVIKTRRGFDTTNSNYSTISTNGINFNVKTAQRSCQLGPKRFLQPTISETTSG